MKVGTFCVLLILAAACSGDDLTRTYLERSRSLPSVSEPKETESLLRFEYDLDGDAIPEVFFSRDSLRDRQGHLWTMYAKSLKGNVYREIGSAQFPEKMFVPQSSPVGDTQVPGFYTYGPGGGGKGTIYLFSYVDGKLENTESKDVDLQDADKADDQFFNQLFAANLEQVNPLNIVKKPLKEILAEQEKPTPRLPPTTSRNAEKNIRTPNNVPVKNSPLATTEDRPDESGFPSLVTALFCFAAVAAVIALLIALRRHRQRAS